MTVDYIAEMYIDLIPDDDADIPYDLDLPVEIDPDLPDIVIIPDAVPF